MSEAAVLSQRKEAAPVPGAILIVDDEAAIRESLETLLEMEGYEVELASTGEEGLARLANRPFDLMLLDFALPDRNGLEVLQELRQRDGQLAVIMITAYGTVENAVRAMQGGAVNFIQKPWDNEKLLADVRAVLGRRRAEEENIQLKRALKQRYNFENIVGKGDGMLRVFDLVGQVAPSRSTVLIQGESGTGKELIAKAIHMNSPRKDRPFVPVNTGSMPADLLESTLFGHVRGAFTSAVASKKGLFEIADQGTLFLDEIATMSLETQAKILRVLQDRKFMHLGGVQEVQVDVRIIAATNISLKQAVQEGRFRDDLFYRLNVITVDLPALRQRREDIPLLVEHFLQKFSDENGKAVRQIAPEALRPLLDYEWPGNVRELENVIERAVVLSTTSVIGVDLLPDHVTGRGMAGRILEHKPDATLFEIVEDCERRVIVEMLEKCNWNQTEAAEQFHVPLSTLNQKIKRLNIEIKRKNGR
ncbi:MAG TPA: sigma-54 dependent transcriptional regulator [Terriglobales bacterium]|jgi:DNA-binding NtrC family response regulator|nr:sigma-54 dependent transcriptional regulator [Terriglobales bacterium]